MKKSLGLLVSGLALAGVLASCNQETTPTVKDEYTFTYDLNYEGAPENRVVTIKANSRAGYWSAKRSGYSLDNWYTTKDLTTAFDFKTLINQDTVVYAKWNKEIEKIPVTVTFDYNYEGSIPTTVSGYKGQTLSESFAPNPDRLGYEVEGWYTDKALTTKFVFSSTVLEGDITLYAKYNDVSNFEYDGEGNIKYTNVSINVALNDTWVLSDSFIKTAITKFNVAYKGKIKVNVLADTSDNTSKITAKFHQTNVFNRASDYHFMEDVLNLAKIKFDADDFSRSAIADAYVNGKLKSYPLAHIAPALSVNKGMLAKYYAPYKTDGTLPSTYQEFHDVMVAYQKGEGKGALVTDNDWTFNENGANLPWSQNDAMLYKYDAKTNKYYNDFADKDGNISQNALNAAKSIIEIFSPEGEIKANKEGTFGSGVTENFGKVKTGDALFGLASTYTLLNMASDNASTLIMPATNLFNVGNVANAKDFVGNYSFAVTNTGPADLYKKAAAGVFIDWFSRNAEKISDLGVVPARKSIFNGYMQTSANETSAKVRIFAKSLDNFITLPGNFAEWTVFNNLDNGYFQSIVDMGIYDEDSVKSMLSMMGESIGALVG